MTNYVGCCVQKGTLQLNHPGSISDIRKTQIRFINGCVSKGYLLRWFYSCPDLGDRELKAHQDVGTVQIQIKRY